MSYLGQDDSGPSTSQQVFTAGAVDAAQISASMVSPVDTTLRTIDQGVNAAASIAAMVPGAGWIVAGVLELGETVINAIGIRSGADEADVITRLQTPLGKVTLPAINAAIPYASATQLRTMYAALQQIGQQWKAFVAQPIFTDGRASTQSLNTVMPVIDGTGDYTSKDSAPGCYHCGPAGGGEDGIEGSILRQLNSMGGTLLAPSEVTQGQQSGYLPTLESPSLAYGDSIYQSGSLPKQPNTAVSTMPAVVSTGLFDAGYWPLIVGAGLLYLFLRKRG